MEVTWRFFPFLFSFLLFLPPLFLLCFEVVSLSDQWLWALSVVLSPHQSVAFKKLRLIQLHSFPHFLKCLGAWPTCADFTSRLTRTLWDAALQQHCAPAFSTRGLRCWQPADDSGLSASPLHCWDHISLSHAESRSGTGDGGGEGGEWGGVVGWAVWASLYTKYRAHFVPIYLHSVDNCVWWMYLLVCVHVVARSSPRVPFLDHVPPYVLRQSLNLSSLI